MVLYNIVFLHWCVWVCVRMCACVCAFAVHVCVCTLAWVCVCDDFFKKAILECLEQFEMYFSCVFWDKYRYQCACQYCNCPSSSSFFFCHVSPRGGLTLTSLLHLSLFWASSLFMLPLSLRSSAIQAAQVFARSSLWRSLSIHYEVHCSFYDVVVCIPLNVPKPAQSIGTSHSNCPSWDD